MQTIEKLIQLEQKRARAWMTRDKDAIRSQIILDKNNEEVIYDKN